MQSGKAREQSFKAEQRTNREAEKQTSTEAEEQRSRKAKTEAKTRRKREANTGRRPRSENDSSRSEARKRRSTKEEGAPPRPNQNKKQQKYPHTQKPSHKKWHSFMIEGALVGLETKQLGESRRSPMVEGWGFHFIEVPLI